MAAVGAVTRVHVAPSAELKIVVNDRTTQRPAWRATPVKEFVTGSVRLVQVRPSGEVSTRPESPVATNRPSA